MKVKKGLEKLYHRIEKDLTEEVGMLRVVWGSMQKAFMDQYEHFTKLIELCYPGANITLEFELKHVISMSIAITITVIGINSSAIKSAHPLTTVSGLSH